LGELRGYKLDFAKDELIRESGLATTIVSSMLTMMELKGMMKHVGGMQYSMLSP